MDQFASSELINIGPEYFGLHTQGESHSLHTIGVQSSIFNGLTFFNTTTIAQSITTNNPQLEYRDSKGKMVLCADPAYFVELPNEDNDESGNSVVSVVD